MRTTQEIHAILHHLTSGNQHFVESHTFTGDISLSRMEHTATCGQYPRAVVLCCSDSRIIPEFIFNQGIGELFVVRIAGNILAEQQLGSIEYALSQLGTPLVIVLGHTQCGALQAAIDSEGSGYVTSVTDALRANVHDEKDSYKASCLNIHAGIDQLKQAFCTGEAPLLTEEQIQGAIYDMETGEVTWLSKC